MLCTAYIVPPGSTYLFDEARLPIEVTVASDRHWGQQGTDMEGV